MLAEPISELTRGKMRKNSLVKWDQRHNKCLSLLKDKLSSAPILQYPDFTKEFPIKTDASQVGLGAMLTQEYEIKGKKISMPFCFASRSLKGAKRQYSVTDQEGLTVVWAVKTFKSYIMGTCFKIVTDHNTLKALVNKASIKVQLAWWADYFISFDMDIIYFQVKDNITADTLSRPMINQEIKELDNVTKNNMVIAKRLNLIIIPEERRGILLKVSHRLETGHLKFNKLLQFLKLRYFWTSMAKDVKEFVDKCNVCAQTSPFINFCPLKPVELNYPFELVSLDTAHITMPSGNKKYIVVAIDHFTQWIEVAILTHETSQSIMNFIEQEILTRHRCPKRIQTDGGKPYVLAGIKSFIDKFNIVHEVSAPYHPESNGKAERLI